MLKKVYGNLTATLEVKKITKNEIGEGVESWEVFDTLKGWLDFQNGSADFVNYNAKIQESTHVFICDYDKNINLEESECRLTINDKYYFVLLIDNPMELNYHYEFYLKYTGD